MGLGSLWWVEQLRLQLWEEVVVEELEEGAEDTEDEEEVWEPAEEESGPPGALMPTSPLTRLNRGSAHRLLLQVVAGSSVKRPV